MTRGFTLVEILIAVVVITVAAAVVSPTVGRWRDRLLVARALNDVRAFYHHGRLASIVGGRRVRLVFTADSLVAVVELPAGDSLLLRRPGPSALGVSLTASNSTVRFYAGGVAAGPGNTTLVFGRGAVADTLVTSRLGRIRRAR